MASNVANVHNYEAVIQMVRAWLAAQRLSLVQDILATLAPEGTSSAQRTPTLAHALGLLATDQPAPSDEPDQ